MYKNSVNVFIYFCIFIVGIILTNVTKKQSINKYKETVYNIKYTSNNSNFLLDSIKNNCDSTYIVKNENKEEFYKFLIIYTIYGFLITLNQD